MLYRTRFLTDSFWEDFFFKNNKDLAVKENQIKEQITQMMELTPELREFFQERLHTMDDFFQHHP